MLSVIVAKSINNVIGINNELPWRISEDLKRFKRLTTGHNIIMGRKTFESLGGVLPNRKHIVLTHDENYSVDYDSVKIIHSVDDIKEYIDSEEENFVIGGGKIYQLLLPYVKKLYITQINEEINGDTFFPEIDMNEWKTVFKTKGVRNEMNDYDYEFINYEKISERK